MRTIKVSHILVDKEYEALDILRALKEGKVFEDLAVKNSKCPSAKAGGALGEVSIARLDEDFAEAAMNLSIGEISPEPVRTRLGYHVIKRLG